MKLLGAKAGSAGEAIGQLPGNTNYLTGSDPAKWHTGVTTYSRVRYPGVYSGIDLTYYGNQRQLEYDFVVHPGSKTASVRMQFDGVSGVSIDAQGDLVLSTPAGELRQPRPIVYQEKGGRRTDIPAGYVMRGKRTVGFQVGSYDKSLPLTIDPVLKYSSYFGGTKTGTNPGDQANAIAVDTAGNVYVTGQTSSTDLLIFNAAQNTQHGGTDAFVFKLDPTGTVLLYSTYFGGLSSDEGHSIAVDGAGNAYITGYTSSDNLPTTANATQKARSGGPDAYLLKLSPAGNSMLFSTFLGGTGEDRGTAVALDPKGGIYVTGVTGSANFPTASAMQGSNAGGLADVFVTKFGPTGTVQYSTFIGGRGNDQAYGLAVDAAGSVYVTGYTTSGCPPIPDGTKNPTPCEEKGTFPRVNAIQQNFGGGTDDAFLFKLNAAGSALEYSTYFGGLGSDNATRVAVNAAGNAFITGYTSSDELSFPIVNPIQYVPVGGFEAFITCFAPDGKSVPFSTYFGGEGNDSGVGIALDAAGNVYVAGFTESILFQTVNAYKSFISGPRDGFILRMDPTGQNLAYATFLGGTGTDGITGLAVDAAGNAYVSGYTFSTDLPVTTPFQPENAGGQDAFVAKLNASDVITGSQFNVSGQGGASVNTAAVSLNPTFGYATADVPNGGSPTGLEIVSLKVADVTVSEVALLAPRLTQLGRIYIEVDSSTRSVISVANPNDADVAVDFYYTDPDGQSSKFVTETIPARKHFSAFVSDAPFGIPAVSSGTVTYTASLPVAVAAFRTFNNERGDFILSSTPVADPLNVIKQPVTIPNMADGAGWDTGVVLTNPTEETLRGELRFLDAAGKPLAIAIGEHDPASIVEYEIAPRSYGTFQTKGTIETTVDVTDPDTGVVTQVTNVEPMKSGSVRVVPFQGNWTPHAHAIVSWSVAKITVFQTSIEGQAPTPTMRMYAESTGSTFDFSNPEIGSTRSAVAIVNPNDKEATVRLELARLDGTATGLTATVKIPAKAQWTNFIHQIPGFEKLPTEFKGILKLTATDSPGVSAVGLRTLFNERYQFMATTTGPVVEDAGSAKQLVFPHIAAGGGYGTEFILMARPNGQGSAGTLQFLNQAGVPLHVTRKP